MQPRAENGRPVPFATPVAAPYFEAAARGELVLQRCPRDGFFFYPRPRCPNCLGSDWTWQAVAGRGTVHAFTIDRVGHDPSQAARLPLVVAAIELEEGPRLTANVVGCPAEEVRVGMPVEAFFESLDGSTLVHFRPRA